MGKLFIVRHGEINFNVEKRYAGSMDTELNHKGLEQTTEVASEVEKLNIDLIITSPLKRCEHMAKIIKEKIQVPIIIMDGFRERAVGVYEGLTREEAKNKYPQLWAKNITRIYDDAPPGGETIREVEKRVTSSIKKIKSEYPDKNILIVTHAFIGKVIHKLLNSLTEDEFFKYRLDNAKIIEYKI